MASVMRISLTLARRVLDSRIIERSVIFVTRKGYKACLRNHFPSRSYRPPYIEVMSSRVLLSPKNTLTKIDYRYFQNQMQPKLFKLIPEDVLKIFSVQWIFALLRLKSIDQTFLHSEFVQNAEEAFCVVINNLAEGDFSGLEDVFTPECLSEVKKRLEISKSVPLDLLALDRENIMSHIVHINFGTNKNGSSAEEDIVTILVAFISMLPNPLGTSSIKGYNVGFTKNYSCHTDKSWRISYINMACLLI